MSDVTEAIRRQQLAEINADPNGREALEAKHGQVWDTSELQRDFDVLGFMAPYVVASRKKVVDVAKHYVADRLRPRYENFENQPVFIMTSDY